MERRKVAIMATPPYADEKDSIQSDIIAAEGEITPEKIPALVELALGLSETFWEKGDFDDAANLDGIYRARAILDLCLEADPDSEEAMWAMIEVAESGWPHFMGSADHARFRNSPDAEDVRELFDRSYEGWHLAQDVTWQLWEKHVQKKTDPSRDDLAVATYLLLQGRPMQKFYKPFVDELRRENPDISQEEIRAARDALRRETTLEIADWIVKASDNKGGEWDIYRKLIEIGKETRFEETSNIFIPQILRVDNEMRYFGRIGLLKGPAERRSKIAAPHERTARGETLNWTVGGSNVYWSYIIGPGNSVNVERKER